MFTLIALLCPLPAVALLPQQLTPSPSAKAAAAAAAVLLQVMPTPQQQLCPSCYRACPAWPQVCPSLHQHQQQSECTLTFPWSCLCACTYDASLHVACCICSCCLLESCWQPAGCKVDASAQSACHDPGRSRRVQALMSAGMSTPG